MRKNKIVKFMMDKPALGIPLAFLIIVGGAIGGRIVYGEIVTPSPVSQTEIGTETDPVYLPPTKVEVGPVVVNGGASRYLELDNDLLTAARDYRLSKLKSMKAELDGGPMNGAGMGDFSGSPLADRPAPPTSTTATEDAPATSVSVSMVIMGVVPQAWLKKGEETQPVVVGDSVFGRKVSLIAKDKVCFSGKGCVRVQ